MRGAMQRASVMALVLVGTGASILGGCVERARRLTPAERERVAQMADRARPSVSHPVRATFDRGVTFLGYAQSATQVRRGERVDLTWFWHASRSLGRGWKLFTHVADRGGHSLLNQDAVGPARALYQPARWRPGQYIRDTQRITIPADWPSDRAVFYVGLWNADRRLAVRSGPTDGQDRVRALALEVLPPSVSAVGPSAAGSSALGRSALGPSAAGSSALGPSAAGPSALGPSAAGLSAVRSPDIPTLTATRVEPGSTPPALTIDGRLDERAWQRAARTASFVHTLDGSPAAFDASARVLYDDEHLYLAFEVSDSLLRAERRGRDAHLWEQDAVEVMLDPDGDGRDYMELQVSPRGDVFDTRYAQRRVPRPFGRVDWNADVRAATHVKGTIDDQLPDEGWSAEIALAWSSIGPRPAKGASWRMAFYAFDLRRGQDQRSSGWSPTRERDFHVPQRFGRVQFGRAGGARFDPAVGARIERALAGGAQEPAKAAAPETKSATEKAP